MVMRVIVPLFAFIVLSILFMKWWMPLWKRAKVTEKKKDIEENRKTAEVARSVDQKTAEKDAKDVKKFMS